MINRTIELCNIDGVSGNEEKVVDFIKSNIEKHCESIKIDSLGNLIAFKKGKTTPKERMMVCAHTDEVGFIAKSFTEDGYIKFGTCGGVDPKVLVGKRVRCGKILGVIGIKAVHLTTAQERATAIPLENLYIDIGVGSKKELEAKISLGDFFAFDSESYIFGDGLLKAKALDDRFGCAVMMEIIKEDIEYDTYFVFTAQEETGLRGARVASFTVNPDKAIIIETTTAADIEGVEGHQRVCNVGEGVVISYMDRSTIYSEEMYDLATSIADKNGIKWQTKTLIAGGNDSGAVHISRDGVKTVALSAPTRYLHSPSCVAKISDLEATYNLVKAFLKEGMN